MALLDIEDLHAFYGKSRVLRGVRMQVNAGEIVSLLGRNGAGRSTLLKAVMGQLEITGSIRFDGEEIGGLRTFEIARRGLAYVPESRDIFPTLSVEQNLMLGEKKKAHPAAAAWTIDDMYQMFPLLASRRHVRAGVMSGGEQQMLTLCRSLLGNPSLILIDEPTEGLAPKMVELVAVYLNELKTRGVSVLLVEQKLTIALDVAQRVYVVGHGEIVFDGAPDELLSADNVRREWLEV